MTKRTREPEQFGGLTLAELREVVENQRAFEADADRPAYTPTELRAILERDGKPMSREGVNRMIDALIGDGKLEPTWQRKRGRDGVWRLRPCYAFVG